jgi:hypothetical protein
VNLFGIGDGENVRLIIEDSKIDPQPPNLIVLRAENELRLGSPPPFAKPGGNRAANDDKQKKRQ